MLKIKPLFYVQWAALLISDTGLQTQANIFEF